MNAGHIATILLVICILLLPPLWFCINCLLERVDLTSHPPPPPQLSSPIHRLFSCLGGGVGLGLVGWAAPPPRQ